MTHVRFVHGVPEEFHSDDAQEFIGNVMTRLEAKLGIKHVRTWGYHPTGNSRVERVHTFLGQCLRMMTDEQYENVGKELPRIAWTWNTRTSDTTGTSPFAMVHMAKIRRP